MAITYVGSAGAAGTGAVTPDFPEGVADGDFLLLRIEGEGEDGNADGPPTGGEWTAVGVGSVASATDGASDRTRLSVYWAPYDPDINRTVPDAGDHTLATIDAFRGVDLDDPFDDTPVSGSSATNTTNHSADTTGLNSTVDGALAVLVASHGDDGLTPGSAANTSLSDVVLEDPWQTSQGSDGTTFLILGTKATAGAIGTFTWSTAASEERAWIAFALREAIESTPGSVSPAAIAAPVSVPQVTAFDSGAAGSATPAALAAPVNVRAVTVSGSAVATPNTLALSVTLPAVTLAGAAVAEPATLALTVALPQVTPVGRAAGSVTPDAISAALAVPQVSAGVVAIVEPSAINAVLALGHPTPAGAAAHEATVVAATLTVPVVSVAGAAEANPNVLSLTLDVEDVTVTGPAEIAPGTIGILITIPQAFGLSGNIVTHQEGGLVVVVQSSELAAAALAVGLVVTTHSGELEVSQ